MEKIIKMGICKLVIKAYDDNSYGSEKGEFVTTINPTNLKISNKIEAEKWKNCCF